MNQIVVFNHFKQVRLRRVYGNDKQVQAIDQLMDCILDRRPRDLPFVYYDNCIAIYRNYGPLFIMVIIDGSGVSGECFKWFEWIQFFMEALAGCLGRIAEIDFIERLPQILLVLNELIVDGDIVCNSIQQCKDNVQNMIDAFQ